MWGMKSFVLEGSDSYLTLALSITKGNFLSRLSAFLKERSSHRTPLWYIWWLHHFQVIPLHYYTSTKPQNLKLQLAAVLQHIWLWMILADEAFLKSLYRLNNIPLLSLEKTGKIWDPPKKNATKDFILLITQSFGMK